VRVGWPHATDLAPRPVWVGLTASGLGLLWFVGLGMACAGAPPVIAIAYDVIVAAGTILLGVRWSARRGWRDAHRLAIIIGAYVVSMLFGFLAQAGPTFSAFDRIGKLVIDVVALVLLAMLAWWLGRRESEAFRSSPG
jgi:hypothetical protein